MGDFYDDTMQGLLEAIEIERGNISLTERKDMPAPTYYVAESDKRLLEYLVEIRKSESISQAELAKMTGNTQQAISRMEKNTHSPSLKLFSKVVDALGYNICLVKRAEA
ncbi:MAG: helix-turn-helix domain-containing protein [Lachnospiraceae bacterium]|nr:helix-turn-helix domain-containing protein [Lachnospiraceae bacterium]